MAPKRAYREIEWTDEQVRRFWDWQSQFPEQYFTYILGDRLAAKLASRLQGYDSLVDFGCGTGFLIPHLLGLGKRVTGVDLSEESVRVANERLKGREGFAGAFTLEATRQRGERFDALVCVEVVEHLKDPQLEQAFEHMKSLVRPGGRIILTTPNDEDLTASQVYSPESDVVFHRYQHVRSWTERSLADYVRSRGLDVVETFTTDWGLTLREYPVPYVKRAVRRLLGRPKKDPNLACVCRVRG